MHLILWQLKVILLVFSQVVVDEEQLCPLHLARYACGWYSRHAGDSVTPAIILSMVFFCKLRSVDCSRQVWSSIFVWVEIGRRRCAILEHSFLVLEPASYLFGIFTVCVWWRTFVPIAVGTLYGWAVRMILLLLCVDITRLAQAKLLLYRVNKLDEATRLGARYIA